ncbi:hypothetical protein OF83DRAFT_501129 [Amylostereum chailletii]|nr:hypothetical protein OF83DRAFT_501129 [Amylostereum chailletii]
MGAQRKAHRRRCQLPRDAHQASTNPAARHCKRTEHLPVITVGIFVSDEEGPVWYFAIVQCLSRLAEQGWYKRESTAGACSPWKLFVLTRFRRRPVVRRVQHRSDKEPLPIHMARFYSRDAPRTSKAGIFQATRKRNKMADTHDPTLRVFAGNQKHRLVLDIRSTLKYVSHSPGTDEGTYRRRRKFHWGLYFAVPSSGTSPARRFTYA